MDTERGCILPLAQSAISGILAGLVAGAVGMWQEWQGAGYIALLVGAVVALVVWSGGLTAWRRSVYAPAVYYPPEQEDQTEELPAAPVKFTIELVQDKGRRVQIADLPAGVHPRMLRQLGEGIESGAPFSESYWTGRNRPFSRSQFRELRNLFLSRQWVAWRDANNPAQGLDFTAAGRAIIRHFARADEDSPPPMNLNPDTW